MRLTTKGRFAVTAMIDVALQGAAAPSTWAPSAADSGFRCRTSNNSLASCVATPIVEFHRGPGGGYSLGKKRAEITVASIIMAIDGIADDTARPLSSDAPGAVDRHATDELWASVRHRAVEFLDSITLQSLVDEQIARGVEVERPGRRVVVPAARVKPAPINAPNSVFALGSMLAKRS